MPNPRPRAAPTNEVRENISPLIPMPMAVPMMAPITMAMWKPRGRFLRLGFSAISNNFPLAHGMSD